MFFAAINFICIILLVWEQHTLRAVAKMFEGDNVVKPLVLEPFKGQYKVEDEDEDEDENENEQLQDTS